MREIETARYAHKVCCRAMSSVVSTAQRRLDDRIKRSSRVYGPISVASTAFIYMQSPSYDQTHAARHYMSAYVSVAREVMCYVSILDY